MSKNILIIGGTRYFGALLVARLIDAGHHLTLATRGLAADSFGDRVDRVRVDRNDGDAMRHAFRGASFDIVFDQMCYTPLQAAVAREIFAGRVARYVMTSTIEVYRDLLTAQSGPFRESDLNLALDAPAAPTAWHDADWAAAHYGLGKRQAEACFNEATDLPFVAVRVGHVLAGTGDFTGRLPQHIARALRGDAGVAAGHGESSFISAANIARFLHWVGDKQFVGAINAADHVTWSAHALEQRIATLAGGIRLDTVAPQTELPFDYPTAFTMDTTRASTLGYVFDDTRSWLDAVLRQQLLALHVQPQQSEAV